VLAIGHCSRTWFQIEMAFGPHWSSSQSQSLTQSVTGGSSTLTVSYATVASPSPAAAPVPFKPSHTGS
jgi:hypothetical protein